MKCTFVNYWTVAGWLSKFCTSEAWRSSERLASGLESDTLAIKCPGAGNR